MLSEEHLIDLIKNDPEEFEKVYNMYYELIFNFCLKRTGNFNQSKDLTAETFLKAFLNISNYRWKGISIKNWLYKIASNEINQLRRSRKYRPTYLSELEKADDRHSVSEKELEQEKEMAEKEMNKYQQFIQIQEALDNLPLKYQEVISLKYFEQMKIKEISRILNKPEGTIKSLLKRGKDMLKVHLKQ